MDTFIYFLWVIIVLPIVVYLCGYMLTKGVLRGMFDSHNKKYKNEKKQKKE